MLEEVNSLSILGVTFDSKLAFEIHLREVVFQESYLIIHIRLRAVSMHMFVQPKVLCPCVNVVCGVLFEDSVARSAERLCEGELCRWGHRRKVSALYLLY